mgnify:CR=1 FL=1
MTLKLLKTYIQTPVKIASLCVVTVCSIILYSGCSSQAKLEKKADLAYDMGEYYRAVDIYERIIEKTKNEAKLSERLYKAANCYRLMNQTKKAAKYYQKSIRKKNRNPLLFLYLAEQKRELGLYDEALPFYEQYKQLQPDDKRADNGIESCKKAREWMSQPTRYSISPMKAFNTKANEFCPSYANTEYTLMYFTSSRESELSKKINPASGMIFTNIFSSRQERTGIWNDPVVLEDTTLNTQWDDGASAFSKDKNSMFYTTCKREQGKSIGCQLYEAQSRGGEWGKKTRLAIVGDSINIGHPSISADGLQLYFAARLNGGFGGSDIWMCERESPSDNWNKPKNLGSSINSPGDEVFPYIREDGTLYFSSDYWVGMGGLDIFRSIKNEDGFWQVSNMQAPMNSPADDFGIVFQGKKEIGMFTSDREEGKGGDDIYEFELPELEFWAQGKLIDKSTKKPLKDKDGVVTLYGSDGTVVEQKRADGTYKFKLKQYTDYIILGSATDYLKKKIKISTSNVFDNKTFEETIALVTTTKPVEIPNIFYDFGKWELNESSKEALVELAKLLEDNPNITIELGSHTDMVGDSLKNMELSVKRAQSVITYLKSKGYDPERLIAKGYGESRPVVVDETIAAENPSFHQGDTLNASYILALPSKEIQDKANQINRRTELRILSSNYIPKPEYFIQFKSKKKSFIN